MTLYDVPKQPALVPRKERDLLSLCSSPPAPAHVELHPALLRPLDKHVFRPFARAILLLQLRHTRALLRLLLLPFLSRPVSQHPLPRKRLRTRAILLLTFPDLQPIEIPPSRLLRPLSEYCRNKSLVDERGREQGAPGLPRVERVRRERRVERLEVIFGDNGWCRGTDKAFGGGREGAEECLIGEREEEEGCPREGDW